MPGAHLGGALAAHRVAGRGRGGTMNETRGNLPLVPYSSYPLWRLREWKARAAKVGNHKFVEVCEAAIQAKLKEQEQRAGGAGGG